MEWFYWKWNIFYYFALQNIAIMPQNYLKYNDYEYIGHMDTFIKM